MSRDLRRDDAVSTRRFDDDLAAGSTKGRGDTEASPVFDGLVRGLPAVEYSPSRARGSHEGDAYPSLAEIVEQALLYQGRSVDEVVGESLFDDVDLPSSFPDDLFVDDLPDE